MRLAGLLLFSTVLLLVVSSVLGTLGMMIITIEVAVLMVLYASIRQHAFSGLMHALVLGLLLGLLSGGGRGVQLIALLPLIPFALWSRRSFQVTTPGLMALACVPAVLMADLVHATLLAVFHPIATILPSLIRVTPASALLSALVAYPLFLVLDRLSLAVRPAAAADLT